MNDKIVVFDRVRENLFKAPVLNGIAFTLFTGIIADTYSSVFVASVLLVMWHEYQVDRRSHPAPANATQH